MAFVLSNHSASPRTIHYAQPFLQFDLRVMSDGADLRIVRGGFDGPAMPAQLVIPAHGTARLETPVTLQFAAQAPPSGDAFAWTVGRPCEARVRALVDACFDSEDYAEGRRAFTEKRPPKFRGR